jgi:uncharacterized protein (TIGR00251 family)
VRVTAGARSSELVGLNEGRLRVRVAAPAAEGRANAELERVVAKAFGVRRSAVGLVRGERSRDKTVLVAGIDVPPAELAAALPRSSRAP